MVLKVIVVEKLKTVIAKTIVVIIIVSSVSFLIAKGFTVEVIERFCKNDNKL
jgi:hypothetical protein